MAEDSFFPQNDDGNFFLNRMKEPSTYKEIIFRAIEKCRTEGSKEMTRGGETYTAVNGVKVPMTIPDQRKVFIQTVKIFYSLMEFLIRTKYQDEFKDINKKINECYKKYLDEYSKIETRSNYKKFIEETQKIPNNELGNYFISQYEDELVDLYREVYQQLIYVFKVKENEFSMRRMIGYNTEKKE